MSKVLVLYYSSYGHIERMAEAVAEGVRQAGAEAIIKRVPELVPEEVARKSNFKLDQKAPIATVAELPDYDAIIIGVPTRFGNMAAQMKNFLDQAGGLWAQGKLIGKVGERVHVIQHAARRTGEHDTHHSCRAAPSRHDHRGIALLLSGSDGHGRHHRRLALRRLDHCRRGRLAPAERQRTRRRALSRPPRRGHREQASSRLDARFFRNMVNDGGRPISQYAENPEKQQHGNWNAKQP